MLTFVSVCLLQIEKPVPEQFRTKVNGDSLATTCVESLG